jgi:hypothetical protein
VFFRSALSCPQIANPKIAGCFRAGKMTINPR